MPIVYRSVRVVLLNGTDDVLTVEGAEVLLGAWSSGLGVKNGETIARQSARAFATESTVLQCGTEGFVRLGSVSGYLYVRWHQPWVGRFLCTTDDAPGRRSVAVLVNDDLPAFVSTLVTISPGDAPRIPAL